MKRLLAIINIALVLAVFLVLAVTFAAAERPTVSALENRELTPFPDFSVEALFSGDYAAQIAKHYDDTIPNRDRLKTMAASMLELTGLRIDDTKIHGDVQKFPDDGEDTEEETEWWNTEPAESSGDVNTEELPPDETEPDTEEATEPLDTESGTEPEPPVTDTEPIGTETDPPVTEPEPPVTEPEPPKDPDDGKDKDKDKDKNKDDAAVSNGVLVVGTRGMTLYGGSRNYARGYVATLKNYKASLGDSVNIYSMAIPTAVCFYLPDKYKSYSADQKADLAYLKSIWEVGTYVDAYSALAPHTEEAIYSRTDHHWQPLGAYYAAQEFAKDAGVPFAADLENDYTKVVVPGYVGTLYSYTHDMNIWNNPEEFIYYKGKNAYTTWYYDTAFKNGQKSQLFFKISGSSSYCSFLGSDDRIAVIKTDCKNGRKLMIIKDSFGNALVPFLTNSFEEIYVTDLRYFEPNAIEFMEDNGITDLLFALCMQDIFGGWMKNLEMIRTQ